LLKKHVSHAGEENEKRRQSLLTINDDDLVVSVAVTLHSIEPMNTGIRQLAVQVPPQSFELFGSPAITTLEKRYGQWCFLGFVEKPLYVVISDRLF